MAGEGQGRLVAWFGREYFAGGLERHDWRVKMFSYHEPRLFDWEEIVDLCGQAPDVIVLGDRSHPPPFLGLEQYPCLTAFYSVDSHIHSWHPLYAQAFDACLVSLRDHIPLFRAGLLGAEHILWSPAFALDAYEQPAPPSGEPEWGLLFVGTVDADVTPGRKAFLDKLGRLLPELTVLQGAFPALYPRARAALNEAERGDLNFRVFEALALGACLLTPKVGHGLLEMFEEGVDLAVYAPGDAADAADKARKLLADAELRQAMGKSGQAKVDAGHRARHRAQAASLFLAERLRAGNARRLEAAGAIRARALRPLYLHWAESCPNPEFFFRYRESLKTK